MTRHALAHRQRALAALAEEAGAAANPLRANANAYELMLAKLDEDRRRLKQLQSIERKIEVKRQLLPEYAAWCEGVIIGNTGMQDDVFMTILMWQIDVGDFDAALPMAAYAIQHGLVMPDRFERTTACLIAEEMAETAMKHQADALFAYGATLAACIELTDEQDMPDQVRAKLHKAYGYALTANPATGIEAKQLAIKQLQRALQLHDKVGVKKDIERLEREVKNTADDTPPA